MRWSEEVVLLQEEMRRVLAFLRWQGHWWNEQQSRYSNLPTAAEEGMRAYALRQSELRRSLGLSFGEHWKDAPKLVLTSTRHPEVATAQF
jgi:hypothetical protein